MATARVPGPSLQQLRRAEVTYTNRVMRSIRTVVRAIRENLNATDPVESVSATTDHWRTEVRDALLPTLGEVWRDGAADTRAHLQRVANRLAREAVTAAGLPDVELFPDVDDDAVEVIEVADDLALSYLATRENFLVGLGDDLWDVIRTELVDGMAAGEGIGELSARLTGVAGLMTGRAERVARTEVVGAANAGSIIQLKSAVTTATKEWVATADARTRNDHVEADGQVAELNDTFTVGGFPMQRPHDPLAPADQVIMCRCTLIYDIPEDELVINSLTAAAVQHTGAMIALIPTDADLDRLTLDEGEPRDELHLTLFFLGEAVDYTTVVRTALTDVMRDVVASEESSELLGRAFGVNYWNPSSDDPAWVLAIGDGVETSLSAFRSAIENALGDDVRTLMPAQHSPWVPHVTLMYGDGIDRIAEMVARVGDLSFDRIRLAFGDEVTDIPIGGDFATMTADGGGVMSTDTDTDTVPTGEDDVLADSTTVAWHGVLAVEGTETGDGREFMAGSLTWADLPIPLRHNIEDSHGGMPTTTAVLVGRIDSVERSGNKIMGRGVFDLGSPHGREAARLVTEGFLKGVSVDVDDIKDADVEFIMPDDTVSNDSNDDDDSDSGLDVLFTSPEKVIFHAGRIRAATLVDIPAFVEAFITIDDTDAVTAGGSDALLAELTQRLGAVGSHSTATSDEPWDGAENEKRLPSPVTVAAARDVYAWIDDNEVVDDELPKSAGKLPHHEVDADGNPGAANLTACSAAIAALNGARGGVDIPSADRQSTWEHLAAHLRDAGQEPPPLDLTDSDAVTAAIMQIHDRPTRSWFADPKLSLPSPVIVTDDGRVYGHAALWGSCHIGFGDVCVSPPHETEHPYYLTGEVLCSDDTYVAVGQITVGTGHAPINAGASRAAEHYDNTGSAVADVCVGNDDHGIWVAGAVRADASAARVRDLRAAGQVSGDWRRIGGQLRLVGLLGINVPGFPVPKTRARVAAGAPLALVAAGRPSSVVRHVSEEDLDQRALRIMRDRLMKRIIGS